MDYLQGKGSPPTQWLAPQRCYRIDAVYFTPWRRIVGLGVILGFMVLGLHAFFAERPQATGILAVDFALVMVVSAGYGLCAVGFFCVRRESIEVSKQAISFGEEDAKRTYDTRLPHAFDLAPLPPPHPTRWHRQTVVVTFRVDGWPVETFTMWNGDRDAERLLERFREAEEAVQRMAACPVVES